MDDHDYSAKVLDHSVSPDKSLTELSSPDAGLIGRVFLDSPATAAVPLFVSTSSKYTPVEQNEAPSVVETVEIVSSVFEDPCVVIEPECDIDHPKLHQGVTSDSNCGGNETRPEVSEGGRQAKQ